MRRCGIKTGIGILLLTAVYTLTAQNQPVERVFFTTDRNSCVSGDTLWFMTYLHSSQENRYSKILHIQLDGPGGNHIAKAIIRTDSRKGDGYLTIPDSLSTGIYVLKAFTNFQENFEEASIARRLLVVYNRFAENIRDMELPREHGLNEEQSIPGIFGIKTDQPVYRPGETITLELTIPDSWLSRIDDLMLTTRLADPLTEKMNTQLTFVPIRQKQTNREYILEEKGITLSGRVLDAKTSHPVPGAVVMASVSDSIPWFDYYYSHFDGTFHFYLREAKGLADLVIQAVTRNNQPCRIELFPHYIHTGNDLKLTRKELTPDQKTFLENLVKISRYERYFFPIPLLPERIFIKPYRYKHPFYGKPTTTVFTRDYITLSSFSEISKELLSASRFREKKDTLILKLINRDQWNFFQSEPFKLLDGIPVFNTRLLAELNSERIERIDIVSEERVFGDMVFNGVIAVYSNQEDISWVKNQSDLYRFDFETVQLPCRNTSDEKEHPSHIPDFRRTLMWKRLNNPQKEQKISFTGSDLKGEFETVLTAVMCDGTAQTASCSFTVK